MNDTLTALQFPFVTYQHKRDNKPQPHQSTFTELQQLFSSHDVRRSKDGPLFSPTIYQPGTTRGNDNVQQLTMLVLDFDSGAWPDDYCRQWESEGRAFIIYSTYSHSSQLAKWRAIFPFTAPVSGADWPRLWRPLSQLVAGGLVDEQCKDQSRIYYLPCCSPEGSAHSFFHSNDGTFLDASTVAPEEIFEPSPVSVLPIVVPSDVDHARKYALSALNGEVQKVASAANGMRHKQRRNSAIALGGFVPTGALSSEEIFEALSINFGEDKKGAMDTIRDGIQMGIAKPRAIPEPTTVKRPMLRGGQARNYIRPSDSPIEDDDEPPTDADDPDEEAVNNGLYAIQNGRTVLAVTKEKSDNTGSSESTVKGFIWDGAVCITGEISDEDGTTVYEVAGKTVRGRTFEFEVDAPKLSDPKTMSGLINNFSGAETVIYAGMEKHIAPSLKSFTDRRALRRGRRFKRVGWTCDGREFIMPGIEPPDVVMALSRDLPYRVEVPEGELSPDALAALDLLINAHRHSLTTVALAHSLLAPLAQLGNWRDDKFALFIAGRTGSFKTSWASILMCLYGDFSNEEKLLKFGMGGTNAALMAITAAASDVPLLIDNFKPGTGNGQKDATTLIHGVIEGGEKKRLNRDGSLRDGKEIHCWPVMTGEDVLDDAASIARMLIVAAVWDGGENPQLTEVQSVSHLLPQVGGAWLSWLMTEEAKAAVQQVKPSFYQLRTKWSVFLRESQPDMVNAARVASSLALCQCAWKVALHCPAFGGLLAGYTNEFEKGLTEAAGGMGNYAAQTHEANRYLAAIRAMVLSNRGSLLSTKSDPDKDDRRAFLGWEDKEFVYVQPDTAYREVLDFLRHSGGLNGLGMNTIHRQLQQLGHLAKHDAKQATTLKRVGVAFKPQRVLWFKRTTIFGDNATDEPDGTADENDDSADE